MGTKNDIWDVNSEEREGRSVHVKQEHDMEDDSDREVDFDDDSTGSCEKEYDTGDEDGGYLGGSGDSSDGIWLKVSTNDSSHETSSACNELEPREIRKVLCKTAVSFGRPGNRLQGPKADP